MLFNRIKGQLNLVIIDFLRGTFIYSYLKKLRKEQFLSTADLYTLSKEKYHHQLRLAKQNTAYYKQFENNLTLPLLTKDLIRKNYKGLINEANRDTLKPKATGGSSGNPLVYATTKEAQSFMWAGILLSWETAGFRLGDRVAFIAGTSLAGSDFKHKIFHSLLHVRTYSAYDLTDERISDYLMQMRTNKINLIYAYASALDVIADYIIRTGETGINTLKSIVSSAEILTNSTRKKIETAFKVRVYNQYGCNEAGVSAFECENGSLHLINSGSWTYTDADDNLIATNLVNKSFLLVNYFTGDKVIYSKKNNCTCGRGYPVIEEVIGRTFEFISDINGKLLHAAFFSILFRNDDSIERYQVQYDTQSISILLKVNPLHSIHKDYSHYIEKIKEHLHFKNYDIKLNVPFFYQENGKQLQVINLSKMQYENLV